MNLVISLAPPEMVTLSTALWQAGITPAGHCSLASSQVRPGRKNKCYEKKYFEKTNILEKDVKKK